MESSGKLIGEVETTLMLKRIDYEKLYKRQNSECLPRTKSR